MKLGISYNVFDGIELLEVSLRQIRELAFHVNVVYQTVSHCFNLSEDENLIGFLFKLERLGLIDSLTEFHPYYKDPILGHDVSVGLIQEAECRKRSMGLKVCRESGCTHFLSMDVDEFYRTSEFSTAVEIIDEKGYDSTACCLKDYHLKPTFRSKDFSQYYVPFIQDIKNEFNLHGNYFVYCDPTRRMELFKNPHLFDPAVIYMHHMTNVRKDRKSFLSKFMNSTARKNFDNIATKVDKMLSFEPDDKIEIVENEFEIEMGE